MYLRNIYTNITNSYNSILLLLQLSQMNNTSHSATCPCVCCCWQRGREWQRTVDERKFAYLVLVTSFFEAKRAAGGAHWSYDPDSIFALIDFWFAELEREGTMNAWVSTPDTHEMMRWANRFIGDAPGLSEELLSWRTGHAVTAV
jgi:hypothetical protein